MTAVKSQDESANRCVKDVDFTLETGRETLGRLDRSVGRYLNRRALPGSPSWCEGVGRT